MSAVAVVVVVVVVVVTATAIATATATANQPTTYNRVARVSLSHSLIPVARNLDARLFARGQVCQRRYTQAVGAAGRRPGAAKTRARSNKQ
jgi:hypothetical protein